ncbi:MAG TPA: CHAP domain-containing protein [Solirubrobacterales bacterium]|nr:CHAP domain-containing protein [Solirubrobacterales bacterium]
MRTATKAWGVALATSLVLVLLLPAAASAALWSYVPKSFTCTGPGGSIVRSNSCLQGTGFNPNVRYWGQATNSRGNCTNYVAYRLSRNGAGQLASSFGNAVGWRRVVIAKLGSKAVNDSPKLGSIAWWGPGGGIGTTGHVAYVEKVADGGRTVYLSESHYAIGSRRLVVHAGSGYWPDDFLHIKDKPAAKPKSKPKPKSPPEELVEEEEPSEEEAAEPSGDTSPPSKPGSLSISARSTSTLTLSWSKASDDVKVTGYSAYRNGSKVANTGSTSYKFSGLSCGTSYTLGVNAYDAAGNRSATATIGGSTSACPKKVTVSKGSRVNPAGCSSSACAFVTVKLSNFGSGSHSVTCYADYPPPTGSYYSYTTSSTTSNVCVYGFLGTHVWVKVDGVESNHLTW